MFEYETSTVSELRSALDELRAPGWRDLSDVAVADRLDEIERAMRILEAERALGLSELERRKAYAVDGHLSAAAWLAQRHGISRRSAEGVVRRVRALEQMPEVARSFVEGEVSTAAIHVLAAAQEWAPEAFARSEEALAEAARTLPFGELRRVADAWKQAADPGRSILDEDRRYERRSLNIAPDLEGMVRVDGELDPESGQSLITAIRAVMDAESRRGRTSDPRTPAQRRADALGEVCRQWLSSLDRPTVAGERPHVVVTMDIGTLEGRAGRRAELGDTGQVTPETARQLACDANVTRVVTDGRSAPLELGRRTKVVPASLRRAVAVRDGGCRFPGCERPPGWCDAHHVRHWADGGETSIGNLVLLCRPHHRTVHRGFGVEMVDGRPVFSRPDGTAIQDRAPPLP